jgi:uncharacterized protein
MSALDTQKKYSILKARLKQLEKVVVAYSGGVDSTFLLHSAVAVLGKENVLAVILNSEIVPFFELRDAEEFVLDNNIRHLIISSPALHEINSRGNPQDRCYYCKKTLFLKLLGIAKKKNYPHVIEGSNRDDDNDYRPGKKALEELSIVSPLREAGLDKEEIRLLSKEEGLPTWNKPARACLVSRFPYHTEIREESLRLVERAESFLIRLGFTQCRVRFIGEKALVEVEKTRVNDALNLKEKITHKLRGFGFKEVEIDPQGYRKGRMNVFT